MPTTFTLIVQFSGLCWNLIDKDGKGLLAVMPDARSSMDIKEHEDRRPALEHVAYLRVDLANFGVPVPAGHVPPQVDDDGPDELPKPPFEVIYQFDRQQLHFDVLNDLPNEAMTINRGKRALDLPNSADYAPTVGPRDYVFRPQASDPADPSSATVGRVRLRGGDLASKAGGREWTIPMTLTDPPTGTPPVGRYAGFVRWTRKITIPGDTLTLRLTAFDGTSNPQTIALKPVDSAVGPVIALKVANLCADNPLEWDEFTIHSVDFEDSDFKWYHRLAQATPKPLPVLRGKNPWPAPLVTANPNQPHGLEDCIGKHTFVSLPD